LLKSRLAELADRNGIQLVVENRDAYSGNNLPTDPGFTVAHAMADHQLIFRNAVMLYTHNRRGASIHCTSPTQRFAGGGAQRSW
jgi:hypothetical protein